MPGAVAMAGRKPIGRDRCSADPCLLALPTGTYGGPPASRTSLKAWGGRAVRLVWTVSADWGVAPVGGGARANSSGAQGLLGRSVPPRGSSES